MTKCRKNKTTDKCEQKSRKSLIKLIFSISSFVLILLITNFFLVNQGKETKLLLMLPKSASQIKMILILTKQNQILHLI